MDSSDNDSQRVGAVSAIPALLRQFGVGPPAILNQVGLRRDALDQPQGRIPFAAMCRLYRESAQATGAPHFGLLAGQLWQLSDMGLAGELTLNSPTVGDALRNLARFHRLNSRGGAVFVLERGNVVDFGYAAYHHELAGIDQVYDSVLATAYNVLRALCGEHFVARDVFIAHASHADVTPYRRLFRAPVHFDAEFTALRFSSSWMQYRVPGADAQAFLTLLPQATAVDADFCHDVCRALRVLLVDGRSSGDDVARGLGLQRRTLNRRLQAEHTTFQRTLDGVRFNVARQLLAYTHINMDDVAASLGYDNVSSFQRRFRQWARTTPGEWRRARYLERP
jgi:AraC-like DNA-binding protein